MSGSTHALSLDVEDFASAALLLTCRRVERPADDVVRLTDQMLELFADCGAKATCFVLGEVAEAYPEVVRRIVSGGHELGVHGWHHHRVFQLEPEEYRRSLERAKALLEDLSGRSVRGYRAVAMSITRSTWWAYDILAELGFAYSSSVYPFRGRRYGVPNAPVGPNVVSAPGGARLLEIPLSVVKVGPFRIPALGGGYFRHLPLAFTKLALWALEREARRAVVYLHPYELDVDGNRRTFPYPVSAMERAALDRFSRSQTRNRRQTEGKIRALLARGRFVPLEAAFSREIGGSQAGAA